MRSHILLRPVPEEILKAIKEFFMTELRFAARIISIKEKKVKNTSGTDTDVGCDIICVHSDTPNAVEIIKSLKKALKK